MWNNDNLTLEVKKSLNPAKFFWQTKRYFNTWLFRNCAIPNWSSGGCSRTSPPRGGKDICWWFIQMLIKEKESQMIQGMYKESQLTEKQGQVYISGFKCHLDKSWDMLDIQFGEEYFHSKQEHQDYFGQRILMFWPWPVNSTKRRKNYNFHQGHTIYPVCFILISDMLGYNAGLNVNV